MNCCELRALLTPLNAPPGEPPPSVGAVPVSIELIVAATSSMWANSSAAMLAMRS
jgi:hypothetical protein